MKRFKRVAACVFSLVMVFTMLGGNFAAIYAQGAQPPAMVAEEADESGENSEENVGENEQDEQDENEQNNQDEQEEDEQNDQDEPDEQDESLNDPNEQNEDDNEDDNEEEIKEEDEPNAAPAFAKAEIVNFATQHTAAVGQSLNLEVMLSRSGVEAAYQWQILAPQTQEETDLLFDYSSYEDTSYYFPFEDITEAELLAINPEATWPGIEMYLESLEQKRGRADDVHIENGTYNHIAEAASEHAIAPFAAFEPEWRNIEGATEAVLTVEVDESTYNAQYRCVVTITDEQYLIDAVAQMLANGSLEEVNFDIDEESRVTFPAEVLELVETQLITQAASIVAPAGMRAAAHNVLSGIKYQNGWVLNLDYTMEYITEDALNADEAAKNAYSRTWTRLDGGRREDETLYIPATLTTDGKLPVLSAWYGKTVYFRVHGMGMENAVAVSIPAFTGTTAAGKPHLYKDAVSVLNVFVAETSHNFYDSVLMAVRGANSTLAGTANSSLVLTEAPMNPHKTSGKYKGESFNEHAEEYLKDAEGNYRYDSVIVGTNVGAEPDISGAAAWALKNYIEQGYGFVTGHDMLYGYGGVNKNNPSYVPNKNSTSTPYYMYGDTTTGHWNMNWLMGTNATYDETSPYKAASMILGRGDATDKSTLYGDRDNVERSILRIAVHKGAPNKDNLSDREPTNYPYNNTLLGVGFHKGLEIYSHSTHTNQQVAFGTNWVDFVSNSLGDVGLGKPITEKRNGLVGTNNFYLTTNGNIAMNQIGHVILPSDINGKPTVYYDEARILANTLMYVSQRQQCQVCQSEQNESHSLNFVHKISSVEDLQKIGDERFWFTHPIDGCYMLTDNIKLPENWVPIQGFSGHFSADNYEVVNGVHSNVRIELAANGLPVFANDVGEKGQYNNGGSGWNLGTSPQQGLANIVSASGGRTTGVARVSGFLNELFDDPERTNWAGHIVVVTDNEGNNYWCRTNNEGKYVIANLPCTGVMEARVYNTTNYQDVLNNKNGVAQNGKMRVNVLPEFWKTNDTTSIYFTGFSVNPIEDVNVFEGETAQFIASAKHDKKITSAVWHVSNDNGETWQPLSTANVGFKYQITAPAHQEIDSEWLTSTKLIIDDACVKYSGLRFKVVFKESANTGDTYAVAQAGKSGVLRVNHYPMEVTHPENTEVYIDGTAEFTSTVTSKYGVEDGLKVQWQYFVNPQSGWQNIESAQEINFNVSSVKVENTSVKGQQPNTVVTTSTLKIINTPLALNQVYVRAVYSYNYTGSHASHEGVKIETEDYAAKLTVLEAKLFIEWANNQYERKGMSFENRLICNTKSEYSNETAIYEADVYYLPGANTTSEGTPETDIFWQYKRAEDLATQKWNQEAANEIAKQLGVTAPKVTITTGQPVLQADGYYKVHTKMTITNVHWKFYSNECFISFAPYAENRYKTEPFEFISVEAPRIPLVVDYKVAVLWNEGEQENHGTYSLWSYPHAEIESAGGIKTLLIEFDSLNGAKYHPNDAIVLNGVPKGMRLASFNSPQYVLFVADTPAKTADVEKYLRENVSVKIHEQTENPQVWVYINAEKNLGDSNAKTALSTFMQGFEQLGAPELLYAQTVTIGWSVSQYYQGGSVVGYASKTDAPYYQWQVSTNNGSTYTDLAGKNAPTLAIGATTANMVDWKYRLKYGESASNFKYSNAIGFSFDFSNKPANGTSVASFTGSPYREVSKNPINIPTELAPYVTRVTFTYDGWVNIPSDNDTYFEVMGDNTVLYSRRSKLSDPATITETKTVSITGGKGLKQIKAVTGNDARWFNFSTTALVYNVKVTGVGKFAPGNGLTMRREAYEAWDLTTVWQVNAPDVAAQIIVNDKVYDGEAAKAEVKLVDRNGVLTDKQLNDIIARGTITYVSEPCVDVGKYIAMFEFADEDKQYFKYNNTVDAAARQTEFNITKRPLYLFSYNNDKSYDKTSEASVTNIQFRPFNVATSSGLVVPKDEGLVYVNPGTVSGTYDKPAPNQTNGEQVRIFVDKEMLSLLGERAHNYYIENLDFKGQILPAGVRLYSRYQEPLDTKNNPRNIKEYDGTANAQIKNIVVEPLDVFDGDTLYVEAGPFAGHYATPNAGELLDENGHVLPDRYNKLEENVITRDPSVEITLMGSDAANYYIAEESYSGAIYRRYTKVSVDSFEMEYGNAEMPTFTTAKEYSKTEQGKDYTLNVDSMVHNDVLVIDGAKSEFVFKDASGSNTVINSSTPVGNYPVSYVGLNEENYPVLSNYVIDSAQGLVKVLQGELIVTVDGGYEKYYGEENPEFGVIITGFKNGESAEDVFAAPIVLSTKCEKDSPVFYYADGTLGKYTVKIEKELVELILNENGVPNYSIKYVDGDISVLPRKVQVVAEPKQKEYGEDDPEPSYHVVGGVVKAGELENLVLTREEGEDVGKYAYDLDRSSISEADAINYEVEFIEEYLTIVPTKLIITADDKSRPLKTPNPTLTVSIDGFKFNDNLSSLGGNLVIKCDAGYSSLIGEYPIYLTESNLESENYIIEYVGGTLTIYDGASIDITKTASSENVTLDEEIVYTIRLFNDGERKLEDVVLTDIITGISGEITVAPSDDYIYQGNGVFLIPLFEMGQEIIIEYSYTTNQQDTGGTTIKNQATATAPDSEFTWPSEEVEVDIEVVRDLSISKTTDISVAYENDTVNYSIKVTNTGNVVLEGVTVEDVMTKHTSILEVVPSNDYECWENPDREQRIFTLRPILPGETIEIKYTLKISMTDAVVKLMIHNTATAATEIDGVMGTDEARITTTTTFDPNVDRLVKRADVAWADIDDTVTYTVVFTNNTDMAYKDISLTDKMNPQQTTIEVVEGKEYYDVKNKKFYVSNLDPGESLVFVYKYKVTSSDTQGHDQIKNQMECKSKGWKSNTVIVDIP